MHCVNLNTECAEKIFAVSINENGTAYGEYNVVINDGTYNGGFRVKAGTFMTINGGSFNDCYGSAYNIYGTATVKGGTYTDAAAKTFAEKYVAEGYEVNANGEVVAK